MKNLLLILALSLFTFGFATANGITPTPTKVELLNNERVTFSAATTSLESMEFHYNEEQGEVTILSKVDEISFLQVTDADGILQYQLPIGAGQLNVSINDFEKGSYTINLLLSDNDSIIETMIDIK